MSQDTPTRILRDQHRNILKIADLLEEVLSLEPEPGARGGNPGSGDVVSCGVMHHLRVAQRAGGRSSRRRSRP